MELVDKILNALESGDNNQRQHQEQLSEIIEEDSFNYSGFQVVRGEFFAHTYEPSITFNRNKVYVNTTCIKKLPNVDYIQFLINEEKLILVLRPCSEEEKDAIRWCSNSSGKRKPKKISDDLFFAKVAELMNWNDHYRYKLLGKIIHSNHEYLIVFDLTATEVYQSINKDGIKEKPSRTPVFPSRWKDSFGLPFEEHQKQLKVNIFDGYTVFSLQYRQEGKREIPKGYSEQGE